MGEVVKGEVIRFDQTKGYGFISTGDGEEDVFLHVNDLLDNKLLVRPGVTVEFVVETGERGLKASSVHVISAPAGPAGYSAPAVYPAPVGRPVPSSVFPMAVPARPASGDSRSGSDTEADDELVDVVPEAEFSQELTELLLRLEPSLSGGQILTIRKTVASLGRRYGWIGD